MAQQFAPLPALGIRRRLPKLAAGFGDVATRAQHRKIGERERKPGMRANRLDVVHFQPVLAAAFRAFPTVTAQRLQSKCRPAAISARES